MEAASVVIFMGIFSPKPNFARNRARNPQKRNCGISLLPLSYDTPVSFIFVELADGDRATPARCPHCFGIKTSLGRSGSFEQKYFRHQNELFVGYERHQDRGEKESRPEKSPQPSGNGSVFPCISKRVNESRLMQISESNGTYRYGPGDRLSQLPKGFRRD